MADEQPQIPQQPQAASQTEPAKEAPKTDRQLLEEIHKYSRKTKNYMMWQLIITVALVVLPLIVALFLVPYAMSSLGSIYGGDLGVAGLGASSNLKGLQDQLKTLQQ